MNTPARHRRERYDDDLVILDFDLISRILKGDPIGAPFDQELVDRRYAVAFVTVGAIWRWESMGRPRRTRVVDRLLNSVLILPCDRAVTRKWGGLRASAQSDDVPDDLLWIAACCMVRDLPLASCDPAKFKGLRSLLEIIGPDPDDAGGHGDAQADPAGDRGTADHEPGCDDAV